MRRCAPAQDRKVSINALRAGKNVANEYEVHVKKGDIEMPFDEGNRCWKMRVYNKSGISMGLQVFARYERDSATALGPTAFSCDGSGGIHNEHVSASSWPAGVQVAATARDKPIKPEASCLRWPS